MTETGDKKIGNEIQLRLVEKNRRYNKTIKNAQ